MSTLPQDAQKIEVAGSTVDFFKYEIDGVVFFQFDSSRSGHPEPMINAMCGLQQLDDTSKLVMINSKAPAGLFPKIENEYNYETQELEDGRFKMIFSRKVGATPSTSYADNGCGGGGCH